MIAGKECISSIVSRLILQLLDSRQVSNSCAMILIRWLAGKVVSTNYDFTITWFTAPALRIQMRYVPAVNEAFVKWAFFLQLLNSRQVSNSIPTTLTRWLALQVFSTNYDFTNTWFTAPPLGRNRPSPLISIKMKSIGKDTALRIQIRGSPTCRKSRICTFDPNRHHYTTGGYIRFWIGKDTALRIQKTLKNSVFSW